MSKLLGSLILVGVGLGLATSACNNMTTAANGHVCMYEWRTFPQVLVNPGSNLSIASAPCGGDCQDENDVQVSWSVPSHAAGTGTLSLNAMNICQGLPAAIPQNDVPQTLASGGYGSYDIPVGGVKDLCGDTAPVTWDVSLRNSTSVPILAAASVYCDFM